VLAVPATGDEQEKAPTPWVLLVETDEKKLLAAIRAWEEAGFGVEIATSVQNALECLAVMTPALIVVDGKLYWAPPPPGAHRAHFQG
jgi:ActR/RegA family two-component response regulator